MNSLKVYGVDDLVDFDTLLEDDQYYPFDKGQVIDQKAVSFFLRAGFVFNEGKWYQLFHDGIYREIREETVSMEIYRFLDHHARKSGDNIPYNSPVSIYKRLKSISKKTYLDKKRDEFISYHDEYCLRYDQDFIPVRNGLIHPETMELLPHCGYFLYPNILGFNYRKLTYDEIVNSPTFEAYLGIFPDRETLEFYLWWVGMVLFYPKIARIILFLHGSQGTGKTTLSSALSAILTPVLTRTIDAPSVRDNKFLTASFENKSLVVMDEMSQKTGLLDDGLFKQITGGVDTFTIEEKHKNPRTATLTCKIMMIGNTFPSFIQDNALINRFYCIRCSKEQDMDIRELLTNDDALNWLFNAGYHYFVVEHPHKNVKHYSDLKTQSMRQEEERYRNLDSFIYWIKEFCGIDDVDTKTIQYTLEGMSSSDVFRNYQESVSDNGGKPLNRQKFLQRLNVEFGLTTKYTYRADNSVRCFCLEDKGVINDGTE